MTATDQPVQTEPRLDQLRYSSWVPQKRSGWAFPAALAVAVALHGALFFALAYPGPHMAGGGGNELGAINITLVDSRVLDSFNPNNSLKQAGGMASAVRAGASSVSSAGSSSGAQATATRHKTSPDKTKTKTNAQPPRSTAPEERDGDRPASLGDKPDYEETRSPAPVPQTERAEADAAAATREAARADRAEIVALAAEALELAPVVPRKPADDQKLPPLAMTAPRPMAAPITRATSRPLAKTPTFSKLHEDGELHEAKLPTKTPPQPPAKLKRQQDKTRPAKLASSQASGLASPASVASLGAASSAQGDRPVQVAGRAAAGKGERRKFAMKVAKTLRRGMPSIAHKKGRKRKLIVKFALNGLGDIRYVKIEKSSGRKRLDRAVIKAMKKIAFPTPPPTMALSELTYRLPFHFN